MNRQALLTDLARDEGIKLYAYDDATGLPLRPGYQLKGHPTIGIGRALDVHGISAAEAEQLANNDIDSIVKRLSLRLAWFDALDDSRQRVLCNIAFNAGVDGLLKFKDTLAAVQAGNYLGASACLMDSWLARDAPERAHRLQTLLLSS